jgi:hypothetical protein
LHEGAPPWLRWSLDTDNHSSSRTPPCELTTRVQGCPPTSSQPGDFHVALRGDNGRNRRSSSASSPEHNGNLREGRLRWPALTGSLLADGRCTVKRLEQALNDYVRIRRSLGYRLREPEGLLRNFIAFLQAERVSYITRQVALRWATQPAKGQPATWAGRLGILRRFAIWHSATEPRTEIPPAGLLPHRYRRKPMLPLWRL